MVMIPELLQIQRYVLTYRFSQDHLELLFNSIRASGGWNNNPSARQFQAIFRHLMRCRLLKLLKSTHLHLPTFQLFADPDPPGPDTMKSLPRHPPCFVAARASAPFSPSQW
uniref:Transposable element P transposase-like RNase H C-terminal domain-containing protein n=1 Tax=Knipowitschia caucasica TaxID=637954 RepID=A0AAV2J0S7_KNICA